MVQKRMIGRQLFYDTDLYFQTILNIKILLRNALRFTNPIGVASIEINRGIARV